MDTADAISDQAWLRIDAHAATLATERPTARGARQDVTDWVVAPLCAVGADRGLAL